MDSFHEDGEWDPAMGCALADFLIGAGVPLFYAGSSAGTGPEHGPEKKIRRVMTCTCAAECRDRPCRYGGLYSTAELGLHAQAAEATRSRS